MLEPVADRQVRELVAILSFSVPMTMSSLKSAEELEDQYASPDAGVGADYPHTPGNEINEPYVDGVSITQGTPRQHIWSLYGAVFDFYCCNIPITSLNFIGS